MGSEGNSERSGKSVGETKQYFQEVASGETLCCVVLLVIPLSLEFARNLNSHQYEWHLKSLRFIAVTLKDKIK